MTIHGVPLNAVIWDEAVDISLEDWTSSPMSSVYKATRSEWAKLLRHVYDPRSRFAPPPALEAVASATANNLITMANKQNIECVGCQSRVCALRVGVDRVLMDASIRVSARLSFGCQFQECPYGIYKNSPPIEEAALIRGIYGEVFHDAKVEKAELISMNGKMLDCIHESEMFGVVYSLPFQWTA